MKMSKISNVISISAGLMFSAPALAQTVAGTIESTITLTSACEVNGSTGTTGVNFGALAFGSHATLFTEAEAEVNGGAGAISVQCSPGADATLTFEAGRNDAEIAGSGRAMKNGSAFVPYDIYRDAAFQNALTDGSPPISVPADGTAQPVMVYGKALGVPGLIPGSYSDTIDVTLAF